ncbi:DUF6934 family protein [Pseudoflavitalea rhizosphaerae]|uniref:DUF6934 family protein n=1 Tax=Pseudoflavitalea rhizosphaerae TaxID=1884793 RepID=UPI003B97B402
MSRFFTVFDYVKFHPAAIVFAEGSTPARTRLHQMGISHNLAVIRQVFHVDWDKVFVERRAVGII